jgi:hypothetical protein
MMLNNIEHDRADSIRRNEGREYRKCPEPAAHNQNKEQTEMRSEAGRPEQKVELSQLHLYPSVRTACQDHYAAKASSRTERQGSIPTDSVQWVPDRYLSHRSEPVRDWSMEVVA